MNKPFFASKESLGKKAPQKPFWKKASFQILLFARLCKAELCNVGKNKNRAFVFSLEAVLSLILISGLLVLQMPKEKKDLHELLIFEKENDLLKIWAKQQKFSLEEMEKDFEFAFPGANGELLLNGKNLVIGKQAQKAIASEISFFGLDASKTSISIRVFE
jgi:hypothetical protein